MNLKLSENAGGEIWGEMPGGPFEVLPVEARAGLRQRMQVIRLRRGDQLFEIGDAADHFYCIRAGRLQVFRPGRGREQSFKIASGGDGVGHREVLQGGAYLHSVRALSDVTVCRLHREDLESLLAEHPAFARRLLSSVAADWADSEEQTYNMGTRKITERLADYLLKLHQPARPAADASPAPGTEVDFFLTREMLATLLGTTTESVIRALSDFKSRGWIDLQRSKVTLKNEEELQRLVGDPMAERLRQAAGAPVAQAAASG